MDGEGEGKVAVQPWERQAGEPERYYAVFEQYLQLGPKRSVRAAVARAREVDPRALATETAKRICAEWEWRKRAAAWDAAHPEAAAEPVGEDGDGRRPWEQQPGEKDRWYKVFRRFLELGPERNMHHAAVLCQEEDPTSPSPGHVYPEARKQRWVERAEAWDREQAGQAGQASLAVRAGGEARQPWEQQPGEKDRWYRVFQHYLALGPTRNVHRAAVVCMEEDPHAPDPVNAYEEARRRRWQERAEAWDLHMASGDEDWGGELGAIVPYAAAEAAQAWDRQAGEPLRAYGLFCHFLELGPLRSVNALVRDLSGSESAHPSQALFLLARRWKWRERAVEWDIHLRDLYAARTIELRTALEERRLGVAEVYFDQAVDAMNTANIGGFTEEEARRKLGTILRILVSMANMQRVELDALEKHAGEREEIVSPEVLERVARELMQR